jgi:ketosteroid isomerase-like protein
VSPRKRIASVLRFTRSRSKDSNGSSQSTPWLSLVYEGSHQPSALGINGPPVLSVNDPADAIADASSKRRVVRPGDRVVGYSELEGWLRMRTTFSLVLISLTLVPVRSGQMADSVVTAKDKKLLRTILAREKEILETLKKNDIKAFANLLADDLLAIDDEGFHGKAEIVNEMEEQKAKGILFTDFSMADVRFMRLGGNAAVLAYKETIRGTDNGKPFVWRGNTHSVYQRRAGKWAFRLFQDTMAK